ncbi:NAD-dependent epimerase/dehydratase family protein [Rhodopirellula sp. JC639]|uniref:NAD-dependent epimerase/dehydratase family protein n=1 Tax=Stieleria mannarensis TaxID=2755585 RepID=UPI001601C515|nr:NAD-dependent epimerase/dehydratase family protein [Rhodopirellula sp. JC639]
MKILITGICGFVGSQIARRIKAVRDDVQLIGLDNFLRAGSELNRRDAEQLCDTFLHADMRCGDDWDSVPEADWVIDCAALPSVLAGTEGHGSSRQLIGHNLIGTLNLLEYCRRSSAGVILISTSRVYSIRPLAALPLHESTDRYELDASQALPVGISTEGIAESFSTSPPVSLYGATKVASETMALEYGQAFGFPVRVNRCGVLAGAGQFARADQGIFSFWVHSHRAKRPLRYIGCRGTGFQVRDCLHPIDVADLVLKQIDAGSDSDKPLVTNVSGGLESSRSLCQLTRWCDRRFGPHAVAGSDEVRRFDLPWIVLDSSLARSAWHWSPRRTTEMILEEIAEFASRSPDWLEISS